MALRIHGVDVEEHIKNLKETDPLSATLLEEVVRQNDRLRRHVDVVSGQCQGYLDDLEHLKRTLVNMNAKGKQDV